MDLFDLVSLWDLVIWVALLLISQALILFFWVRRELKRQSPQRPFDPFTSQHGDWPLMPLPAGSILEGPAMRSPAETGTGYSARELDRLTRSARRAAPAGQGSGGDGTPYQGAAAASPIRGRERRAF
jgi:hypothetical protein